ncbi:MAG: hypothetical protein N3B21_13615 [Clostridia bacterium]|nr:hypothetical protein [Clostridia bacterium]
MFEVILYVLIGLLALFGGLTLVISVLGTAFRRARGENRRVKLVVLVKDQQETVEGLIRSIYARDFLKRINYEEKLVVLDMDSSDETLNILMKLKDEYEYIEVLTESEKEKIFEGFMENK